MAVYNPEICLEKNSTGLIPWNFDPACSVCHSIVISYSSPSTRSSAQLVILFFNTIFVSNYVYPENPEWIQVAIHSTFFIHSSVAKYTLT